jgi:hypothetical protein
MEHNSPLVDFSAKWPSNYTRNQLKPLCEFTSDFEAFKTGLK